MTDSNVSLSEPHKGFSQIEIKDASSILAVIRNSATKRGYSEQVASFFSDALIKGFGFNIYEEDKSTGRITRMYRQLPSGSIEEGLNPVLQIKNLDSFFQKLAQLETVIDSNKKRSVWLEKISISVPHFLAQQMPFNRIWLNSTYSDLENPIQFLERIKFMINDMSFPDQSNWEITHNSLVSLDGDFYYRFESSSPTMEAPHELHFAVTQKDLPDESQEIQTVRFGKTGEDEVTIYAIQMPKISSEKKVIRRFNIGRIRTEIGKISIGALSLSAAIDIFKSKGIKKIRIPTYLPLRAHDYLYGEQEGDEIDKRIRDQFLKTLSDCFPDINISADYEVAAQINDYLTLTINNDGSLNQTGERKEKYT